MKQQTINIEDALSKASTNIDSLDARLLLEFVKGVDGSYLFTHGDEKINIKESKLFFDLVQERKKKKPLAYLVGKKGFWKNDFFVDKSVLVPRPETEMLVEKLLEQDLDNKDSKKELESNRVYKLVDTCSAEFVSKTPYLYSTNGTSDDDTASKQKKVVVIGSGPNRIGQGIEFDYCCVHGVSSLKENGYEAIMINSNPETVSTDYDTADKLYFEPLSWNEVKSVLDREKPDSVIIQLGGQTPLKLAKNIHDAGFSIAGSSLEVIDSTEDRDLFQKLCSKQNIKQPLSRIANSEVELVDSVNHIGFPVLLRPSYVLGGRAMRVVQNNDELNNYLDILASADEDGNPFKSGPLLVDQFLTDTIEIDVDLISDGEEAVSYTHLTLPTNREV